MGSCPKPVFRFLLIISAYIHLAAVIFAGTQKPLLPGDRELGEWTRSGRIERFAQEALFGYINGGAEIFLQYGFRELEVGRYVSGRAPGQKEVTVEIYRMESPSDAFGIFSVKRTVAEKISLKIAATNWVSETQVNLAKAEYFINITGFKSTEADLEEFASFVAGRIEGEDAQPSLLTRLPEKNRIPASERHIRGELAASAESPLLAESFWRFKESTRAVSAKYGPARTTLVLVELGMNAPDLTEKAAALFRDYMQSVAVKTGIVEGKNAAGRLFLFKQDGTRAFFVLAEPDPEFAFALLNEALRKNKA